MTNLLELLVVYCTELDRVCPEPQRWSELYQMLMQHRRKDSPELYWPLILGGWWDTSHLDKIIRLQHHLKWAESHGCLPQADAFLRGLPEDEWHHVGD